MRKNQVIMIRIEERDKEQFEELAAKYDTTTATLARHFIKVGLEASTSIELDPELPTLPKEVKHAIKAAK
jgi:hypothetical protein